MAVRGCSWLFFQSWQLLCSLATSLHRQSWLHRARRMQIGISFVQLNAEPATPQSSCFCRHGAAAAKRVKHAITGSATGKDAGRYQLRRERGNVAVPGGNTGDAPDAAPVAQCGCLYGRPVAAVLAVVVSGDAQGGVFAPRAGKTRPAVGIRLAVDA